MTINRVLGVVLFPIALTLIALAWRRGRQDDGTKAIPAFLFALAMACYSLDLLLHPVYTLAIVPVGLYFGTALVICSGVALFLKSSIATPLKGMAAIGGAGLLLSLLYTYHDAQRWARNDRQTAAQTSQR